MTQYVTVVDNDGNAGFAEVLEGDHSAPRKVGRTLSPSQLMASIETEEAGSVSFDTPQEREIYKDVLSWLIAHGAEPYQGYWSGQTIYSIEYWQ